MQSINLKCEISKPYRWAVNFPWQAHENKCKCRFLNWATFGRVDAWNFHGAQSNRWCKVKLHKSHLNLKISGLLMLPFFSRPAVWIFCIILSDEAFKVDVALELLSFWGILVFRQHDLIRIEVFHQDYLCKDRYDRSDPILGHIVCLFKCLKELGRVCGQRPYMML